jgi:hypothetical protein
VNHYLLDLIIVLGLWAMPFVILAVWVWRDSRRDAEHIGPLTRSPQPPWDVGLEECFAPPAGWPECADDEDDVPHWLSVDDLDYRGGGIMSRRREGGWVA